MNSKDTISKEDEDKITVVAENLMLRAITALEGNVLHAIGALMLAAGCASGSAGMDAKGAAELFRSYHEAAEKAQDKREAAESGHTALVTGLGNN